MNSTVRRTLWILVMLAISWAFAEGQTPKSSKDLLFTIRPTHRVLDEGTDVTLHFSLKNLSTRRILVIREASLHDLIYLEIVDGQGKEISWQGKIVSRGYPADFFTTLEPGQSVSFHESISLSNGTGYDLRKSGTYRIRAEFAISPKEYFAQVADGAVILERPVRSNWTRVIIKEPVPVPRQK